MSKRARGYLVVLGVVALLIVAALQVTNGLAQTPVTWTAGPGDGGTGSGLVLETDIGDSPVAAPTSATDSSGQTKTVTVFPANPNSPADIFRYLYYDVDTGSFPTGFSFARVDVEYLDEASLAGAQIDLQYDSFTDSQLLHGVGTGRFEVASFHLSNVQFRNGLFNTADFRLRDRSNKGIKVSRVTVTGSTTSTRTVFENTVTLDIPNSVTNSGLTVKPVGDGVTSIVNEFGRAHVKVSSAGYVYLDVDDGFIFQGNVREAVVEVSYFDKGFGKFYVGYDGLNAAGTGTVKVSFGPEDPYQSNNIVYLNNSQTWKSYRFNLSNIYFGNNPALGGADLRIHQPHGGENDIGNQGYDLRVDKVTVTKKSAPVDKTEYYEGNFSGFGTPNAVWTRLGAVNEQGHGLYQEEAGGATVVASAGGKEGRRANNQLSAIYFNVNDLYIKDAQDLNRVPIASVLVGVEYFDAGSGTVALEYDSTAGRKTSNPWSVGNSNSWKRATFYLTDARFNNGLSQGGSDFGVVLSSTGIAVRDVVVSRLVGEHRQGAVPAGWLKTQRFVGVFHTPQFDGFRPALWERSTIGPKDSDANTHVGSNYSYRSVDTWKQELTDMRDAGIDVAFIWYTPTTLDDTQAVVGLRQAVEAAKLVANAPKFALLLDPNIAASEGFLRDRGALVDTGDAATQGIVYRMAEDYFSLIPRDRWATIEGRPMIAVYGLEKSATAQVDLSLFTRLRERFQASHGVNPYVIGEFSFDPNNTLNLDVDERFIWGGSYCPGCVSTSPGFADRNTFEIGPGFLDTQSPPRSRDRENGNFYRRSWDRAIATGNHMVLIDTFNYFPEGSAIGETREFGRTYLDITREKSAVYKAGGYGGTASVSIQLGGTNLPTGVAQHDVAPDGLTEVDSRGGRRSTGSLIWFSVDDSFILGTQSQVTISGEYLDTGVRFFDLHYDSPTGLKTAGRVNVQDFNTGQFKTFALTVPDAFFANRVGRAFDILLAADTANGLVIKSLTVTKQGFTPPTPTAVPCASGSTGGGGAVPTPDAGTSRIYLPLIYRNACGT